MSKRSFKRLQEQLRVRAIPNGKKTEDGAPLYTIVDKKAVPTIRERLVLLPITPLVIAA